MLRLWLSQQMLLLVYPPVIQSVKEWKSLTRAKMILLNNGACLKCSNCFGGQGQMDEMDLAGRLFI